MPNCIGRNYKPHMLYFVEQLELIVKSQSFNRYHNDSMTFGMEEANYSH